MDERRSDIVSAVLVVGATLRLIAPRVTIPVNDSRPSVLGIDVAVWETAAPMGLGLGTVVRHVRASG